MSQARPVRVLHVVKGLGPGGAERLLASLAAVSDRSQVELEVAYVLDWKRHLVPELEALGVPCHLLAGGHGMADPRWPLRLRRLAGGFDVVHLHSPAVAAIARPVLRTRRGGPVVVSTEHNVWASHGRLTRLGNALTLPLDRVRWAVSEEVRASVWRPWRARTEVLRHGAPVGAIAARIGERSRARAEHGWLDGEVVVATVANLRANKDYPNLFAAAALALERAPQLRFVSVGQGPLEDELRSRLAALDLSDRFVMLGYREDPVAVLAGADAFVLSSRHEGLPISLIEAMALGLPPIVTRVGGNAEVVTNDVDGLLVPPVDPDALAEALVLVAGDEALRRRLGAAAEERSLHFDIQGTARILEARYRSIVGLAPGP